MEHGEDPLEELVDHGDLVEVPLALLDHSENAELDEVGVLAEDVGQFEESGVDEDGEGVPLEEARKANDCLALNSEYCHELIQ